MSKHQDHLQKAAAYFSFGFTGRIGRLEFANRFVTYLLLFIVIFLLYYFIVEQGLFSLFDGNDRSTDMTRGLIKLIFYAGFLGAFILLNIRVVVMRLHDINLSGWWSCALFIFPYATDLVIIMLPMTLNATLLYTLFYLFAIIGLAARLFPFIMPGNEKSNRYGAATKTGNPIGACLLVIMLFVGAYFLYRYITLQSISVTFLQNIS